MGSSVSMSSLAMRNTLLASAACAPKQPTKRTAATSARSVIMPAVRRMARCSMVMMLPFLLGFVAAVFAYLGARRAALGTGLATVVVQVWWLFYHATDKLAI